MRRVQFSGSALSCRLAESIRTPSFAAHAMVDKKKTHRIVPCLYGLHPE